MSLFGKLLLVANMVLAVCFLALAGAVYSTQQTWKQRHDSVEEQLAQTRTNLQAAESAKNDAERRLKDETEKLAQDVSTFRGRFEIEQEKVATLTSERDAAETKAERAASLATTQANEAQFRTETELVQRGVNESLHTRLEQLTARLQQVQDDLFTEQLTKSQLEREYLVAAEELTALKRRVGSRALQPGGDDVVEELAGNPPPEIDGLVQRTGKNDAGQVDYVALSIGSDDGLEKGQSLTAYRPGNEQTDAKYLGRVTLVTVNPDSAVARVDVRSKQGIIEEGDRVTSRL